MSFCTSSLPAVLLRRTRAFLLSGVFVALVWGLAASGDLFAQVQPRVFIENDVVTIEEQVLVKQDLVLAPRQEGLHEYAASDARNGQADGNRLLQATDGDAANPGYPEVTLVYDTYKHEAVFAGREGDRMAQRYNVPSGGRLTAVLVAPAYLSNLERSPIGIDAPKDFTLRVWKVASNGSPGQELYSLDVEEPTDVHHIAPGPAYVFARVDLPAEDLVLASLPDRIFIGLVNKGTDVNYLAFVTSPRHNTAPKDAAYWYRNVPPQLPSWAALEDVHIIGESTTLADHVLPIRPVFHIPSDGALQETIVSYDIGENVIPLNGGAGHIATNIFDVPPKSRLASVSIAPSYDNEYRNSSLINAGPQPRDFTLKVWDIDENGLPGNQLYSVDVDEGSYASHRLSDGRLSFLHIDMPADYAPLSDLQDRIFIGLVNTGQDENYLTHMAVPRTPDSPENRSYLYTPEGNWNFLSAFQVTDGPSLSEYALAIRARFLATAVVSAEDAPELPFGVELAQNYPNPFNPATSIAWTQSDVERVRLSVYDLLGRQVAVPADGLYPAGRHEVRLDASGWPSGVYTYVLETETGTQTRPMALVK